MKIPGATRTGEVKVHSPVDTMALRRALEVIQMEGWNASVVVSIEGYTDGSVKIKGKHWHARLGSADYVVTASANGYAEVMDTDGKNEVYTP